MARISQRETLRRSRSCNSDSVARACTITPGITPPTGVATVSPSSRAVAPIITILPANTLGSILPCRTSTNGTL